MSVAPTQNLPPLDPTALEDNIYESWRKAFEDVLVAYRHWCAAPRGERALSHAVYIAAADRETAAADHLRRRTVRP